MPDLPASVLPPRALQITAVRQRVLVVDDSRIDQLLLQQGLDEAGFLTRAALSAEDAVDLLEQEAVQLVILDSVLPGMSGLALLRWIRGRWSPVELPVIMASSRSDDEDVVGALDEGANDFVTKPLNMTVVMARIRSHAQVQTLERNLHLRQRELEQVRDALQRDIDAAARIQKGLLPQHLPENSSCWYHSHYDPCASLGGDVFNVLQLDRDHRAVYMIDVSGHGVPAALLAVSLANLLSTTAEVSPLIDRAHDGSTSIVPPERVAERLNQRFQISRANLQYFTMLYGILEERTGTFTYIQAGHPPPICLRADGSVDHAGGSGLPIGLLPDSHYGAVCLRLQPGDHLFLYSDGLTEACDRLGQAYGLERLCRCVQEHAGRDPEQVLAAIAQTVADWCAGEAQRDDYSMLVLSMKD